MFRGPAFIPSPAGFFDRGLFLVGGSTTRGAFHRYKTRFQSFDRIAATTHQYGYERRPLYS